MARRHDTTPDEVSSSRIRWLDKQLRRVRKDQEGARSAGSWSATAALLREERGLRDQLDTARLERARQQERVNDTPLTGEERAKALERLVDGASEDELEVAVGEWLKRRRYRLFVDEGGTLHLLPLGEQPKPALRLVR